MLHTCTSDRDFFFTTPSPTPSLLSLPSLGQAAQKGQGVKAAAEESGGVVGRGAGGGEGDGGRGGVWTTANHTWIRSHPRSGTPIYTPAPGDIKETTSVYTHSPIRYDM